MKVLSLTWAQIDWDGLVITISGDQTKGEDDCVFPFGVMPDLKALLERQFAARDGLFVFHRSFRRTHQDLQESLEKRLSSGRSCGEARS